MSKPKLSYFNFPGSRGEECRLALHLAGVEFEDDRLEFQSWPERKPTTPFGSLPVLEIPGRGTLAQSNAILGFIGRGHGLHPSDSWEAARHESLMHAVEDLRAHVSPKLRISGDEKLKVREELANEYLPRWGRCVEQQLSGFGAGPFVAGDKINVVDLKLYIGAKWFSSGTVDHVPATIFDEFPRLRGIERAVAAHPKVVEWYSRG